jgi:hypothetical protein
MDYQIKILNLLSTYFKIKTPSKMSKTTEFSASSDFYHNYMNLAL